ncbi:MAG: RAD55 family ATPase, partial [Polyangiaceae bacterium]
LMAWECTSFLIGEYGQVEFETNPLFSIVDGLVTLTQEKVSGEHQRFFRVLKMRGTDHSRDDHPFVITVKGIEVFAPRVAIQRAATSSPKGAEPPRLKVGISKLDDLLGKGVPLGSSLLVGGVAGTGKTVLSLEFVYRGALAGERGIFFSFEETEDRLRATARGLGWDLDREIERGMVEIVFIPQPNIMVEKHLLMMQERVEATGARRVAIDSVSVFLHKVKDTQLAREKIFQLASVIQNNRAVGFFVTDIPYGSETISRLGVEETVVDGVILLTSTKEGAERQRYIEVYKLRNTDHLKGTHSLSIGSSGVTIYPRYRAEAEFD